MGKMLSTGQMNLLKKQNDAHEKNFQAFHKKIFNKMLKEATKMAVEILVNEDDYPTSDYSVFEEKSNRLVKTIIKEKIRMLGSYLR